MAKLTRKLMLGLQVLGLEHNPATPNIVIYGKLTERGYVWNGNVWEQGSGGWELSYPVQVRIMADGIIDCSLMASFLAKALQAGGFRTDVSTSRPNREGNGYRAYITVE